MSELTNLLPERRARAFRRQYFVRLATVAVLLLIFVILVHSALLIPTYLYANGEAERAREDLAMLQAAAQTSEEQEVAARTKVLKETATYLRHLDETPTGSTAIRTILSVPRPGVRLTGFTFSAASGPNAFPRMQVSGMADSRDALRSYAAALGALPYVTSADLPISAYAQERNIEFTITLSGSLKP